MLKLKIRCPIIVLRTLTLWVDFVMERGKWFKGSNKILSMQKLWSKTVLESESSYHLFHYAPRIDVPILVQFCLDG
jgi:hypothetical protein